MQTVSVSELKAHLSRYLRDVRRGGEVQVLDRGRPIARLIGLSPGSTNPDDDDRERLVRAGVLRPGTGDSSLVLDRPPLELGTDLRRALDEDRDDRL
ncbi:type II toxin-antitoxin system Phd/YefM family antitoxin [Nitriliruptor alkaliphilus]|uniref:type II toxin-antitoxin system Phd/YefM family antitoxin n=1 Tax=Nitriliruptor alkaliphilus TaxID=427918 RepID=UPI0006987147|nr:type II toxin-antitoxin system prevent-host-death family antitoxin [Nitriliruptor alkaliphilus]